MEWRLSSACSRRCLQFVALKSNVASDAKDDDEEFRVFFCGRGAPRRCHWELAYGISVANTSEATKVCKSRWVTTQSMIFLTFAYFFMCIFLELDFSVCW
jgi:hypothetical protein